MAKRKTKKTKRCKGFTLIELLVVIAIIGLLSTMAVVSLNNARLKSRDAKRVSDISQTQLALELYFNDKYKYPVFATAITLGSDNYDILCYLEASDSGFRGNTTGCGTIYMGLVPKNPTPNGADYSYTSLDGLTYSISFKIEGSTGELKAPNCTAEPKGIICTGSF